MLEWVDFFRGGGVVAGPTTTLAQVQLEASAKAALADGIAASKVQPMQLELPEGQVQMPMSGPIPLPYDDVFDISMYSAQEIGGDNDVLAAFDEVNHAYISQMKIFSRRQMAATCQSWA